MFEPIFSLRVHGWIQMTVSQLAGVCGCRRKRQLFFTIGCWLFMYTDVTKTSISSFRRVGTAFSGELPQARTVFALRQLLWPDYSTYKSFDSSTKVIPSLLSYGLLCVIGSEINYPPSLKLHDATLTD